MIFQDRRCVGLATAVSRHGGGESPPLPDAPNELDFGGLFVEYLASIIMALFALVNRCLKYECDC
jgi:hypothetical protein